MQEQEQNRTEQATPFKLTEARKRGQVAKSLEFNTLVMVGALLLSMSIWGAAYWHSMADMWRELFLGSGDFGFERASSLAVLNWTASRAFGVVLPFLVIGAIAAIVANYVQTGPILSIDPLKPKSERISPVAGFKRIFNKRMLFEALKSVIKLIFFSTIVYVFLASALPSIAALTNADPGGVANWLAENALSLLFRLGLGLLVVGILDLAYVRWSYNKQMMMSRREVKEEVKRREGDPQIRAKIRELQRENLKQARSMGNLPDADVLITNPTHFAVALKYDRATMDAPVVLAKGSDEWVVEMKAIARQNNIPILERKKLARSLFKHGSIDHAIPPDSFVDVARVYAELNAWKRRRVGDEARYEVRL